MSTPDNLQMAVVFTAQQTRDDIEIKEEVDTKAHCRFCADLRNREDLLDLTLHEETYTEFLKILSFLKVDFVDLSRSDDLPKTTCEPCSTALNDAFFFFKKVKRSQVFLKSYYGNTMKTKVGEKPNTEKASANEATPNTSNKHDGNSNTNDNSNQSEDCTSSNQEQINVPIVELRCADSDSSSDSDAPLKRGASYEKPKKRPRRKASTVYRKPRARKTVEKKTKTMKGSWNLYKWICIHCSVKCDTMYELRNHSKDTHNICYGFKCVDCEDDFNTFNSFIEHVRRHRVNLRFYCQYCNERFESHTACFEHTATHWEGTQKVCDRCGEVLPDQGSLERHRRAYKRKVIARHSRRKGIVIIPEYNDKHVEPEILKSWTDYEWTCLQCCARQPDLESLRQHSQQVHNKCFSMKCVDCLLVRTCFSSFVTHVRRHRPLLHKFCQYCNMFFRDPLQMTEHIKTHTDRSIPPCDGCGQLFESSEQLKQHVKQYDPPRKSSTLTKEDLTCEICDKEFTTKATLRNHREIHDVNREKRFACDFCGKAFFDNTNLRNHLKLHSKKTEECHICNRKFHAKPYLKNHLKTHTDVKPFACTECGKHFRLKRQLQNHMLTHTDIKPYKCLTCGKEFRVGTQLKVHEVQHTGVMPYSCKFCERKFGNWSNCNKHMIRKHGTPLAKTKMTAHGRVAIDSVTLTPDMSSLGNISAQPHNSDLNTMDIRLSGDNRLIPDMRLGNDLRLNTDLRLGTDSRLSNEMRMGTDSRLATEMRLGIDSRLNPDMRLGLDSRVGTDMRLGMDSRLGTDMRLGMGAEMRLGTDSRMGTEMRMGPDTRMGTEMRLTSSTDSRMGTEMRLGTDSRMGTEMRLGTDSRMLGNDLRIGSDMRLDLGKYS